MMLAKLWYLGTILLFAGTALAIEWRLAGKRLRAYTRALLALGGIGLLTGLLDRVGVAWKAWGYNAAHSLHIVIFGGQLETYVFTLATALAVGCAAMVVADYEAAGQPILKTVFRRGKGRIMRPAHARRRTPLRPAKRAP